VNEAEAKGVGRWFAHNGEAILSYVVFENGYVTFNLQRGARKYPLATVRLLARERVRLRGTRFLLLHEGDRCLLRVARLIGVHVPAERPCEITL
jgi:hypothetical protein